jgi:hypothetical protein
MVAEEGTYLLLFSVEEDRVPGCDPIFDQTARSFRLRTRSWRSWFPSGSASSRLSHTTRARRR